MSWLRQEPGKPLFEDVLWLKPENPHQRPKVLIIGGSSHGFVTTTKLYEAIKSKSAYQTRLIMPKSLEKILGHAMTDAIFADSTSSGEIAGTAKNEILSAMNWAEAVIFSDDLGNNSQTEILVTELLKQIDKPTYFLGQAIDLLQKSAQSAVDNPHLIFVGELAKISKLNSATTSQTALLQADGLIKLVEKLQDISAEWNSAIITQAESQIIVAERGRVATTKSNDVDWLIHATANSVQFGKMFDLKRYEAIVCGVYSGS
jgi:NAD(P)H-hydrate repair Nnr-like enzyme with NAD(P)H-hydrate dehydratase domain